MSKNVKALIKYWQLSAEHDYITMRGLFGIKRYSDCLFFGHIILEKILKALVVQNTKQPARYSHNLIVLSEDAGLSFSEQDLKLLDSINRFNIRSRYPDVKFNFYKICTKKYSQEYLDKIIKLYKLLCQKLEKEK